MNRPFAIVVVCLLLFSAAVRAADPPYPAAAQLFPHADQFTEFEGTPPVSTAKKGEQVLGYLYRTNDIAAIPAYSGKPINQLVGFDLEGSFVGASVLEHHEPILLVGIPETRLDEFLAQYQGKKVTDRVKVGAGSRPGYVGVDAITGATVTVMVMNEALMRGARAAATAQGVMDTTPTGPQETTRVRSEFFEPGDWKFLTGNGAIRRLHLTRRIVDMSFKGTDAEGVEVAPPEAQGDTFIDLYYAYLNAPTIGRNLLGESQYNWLMAELKPDEHAIAILGNGLYSFKGSGYVRGGIFDRVQLTQEDREISFRDLDYHRLSDVYAEGMPEFQEMAIFVIRETYEFDPGKPWRLELLVKRQTGPLDSVFANFTGDYQLPDAYVERTLIEAAPPAMEAELDQPIWISVWQERKFQTAVLVAGLALLTAIMFLQDWLARFPRVIIYLRNGFLVYTLFFVGWYLLGQLSVVNVLTFVNAMIGGFSWDTFLIDPTMFILWTFVAVTLLLWGRGVYCGWLCPYGALQRLVNEIALLLKVPQWHFPPLVNERLWAVKYIILLVLFGISLQSIGEAERYAEVEPFKTAITLRFDRDWPFVLYAGGLVLVSAFNCKFFCKYLCPLGAALAIPARFRLFDWLKRRKECGKPCQICAQECEIQAITHTGEIVANECHYCLDCQVTYWDQHKCPPLVQKRKRREKAGTARARVAEMEETFGPSGLDDIPISVEEKPRSGKSTG